MHFYVLLTPIPPLLSFYCVLLWLLSCKLWIRRLLLTLNGGVSLFTGSSYEALCQREQGQTLGMLLFCETLCLVWKQRASLPSRKWTALSPPVMMHNYYTSIHFCKPQWGWPLKPNYYSLANVRESCCIQYYILVFSAVWLHSFTNTYLPTQPRPQCYPFPLHRACLVSNLSAFIFNFKQGLMLIFSPVQAI